MNTEHAAQTFLDQSFQANIDHAVRATGNVINIDQERFLVRLSTGQHVEAKQAFSCAYSPIVNDLVEVISDKDNGIFILSILNRSTPCTAQVNHPYGIEFSTPSIKLKTNETAFESQRLKVQSQDIVQNSDKLSVTTSEANYVAKNTIASSDTLIQKVKDSFKFIERIEQIKAQDVIQTIKNAFIQRSKQVDISAKTDVKINGDRIHMG